MLLPEAYRSLARPSSALEPSHPPDGIFTRVHLTNSSKRLICTLVHDLIMIDPMYRTLHPSRATLLAWCTNNGLAGTRTQGLCLAKAAIFQLIYKPIFYSPAYPFLDLTVFRFLVGGADLRLQVA